MVVSNIACAEGGCADAAIAFGAIVDAKNSGATYANAKRILEVNRKTLGSNYQLVSKWVKLAYEQLSARNTAGEAAQVQWNVCKETDPTENLRDLCFLVANVVGSLADERDRGTSIETIRKMNSNQKLGLNDAVLNRIFEEKSKSSWELEKSQYFDCVSKMKI